MYGTLISSFRNFPTHALPALPVERQYGTNLAYTGMSVRSYGWKHVTEKWQKNARGSRSGCIDPCENSCKFGRYLDSRPNRDPWRNVCMPSRYNPMPTIPSPYQSIKSSRRGAPHEWMNKTDGQRRAVPGESMRRKKGGERLKPVWSAFRILRQHNTACDRRRFPVKK